MALNRQERRALREIEDVLAEEDAALAGLLHRGGEPWGEYVVRRTIQVVLGSAITLLVLGLVLADTGMMIAALLALMGLPVGVWFLRLLLRNADGSDGG